MTSLFCTTGLFSLVTNDRMRGNGKRTKGTFRLVRQNFFIIKVIKQRNSFYREMVDVLCLSVFTRHLDNSLNFLYLLVSSEVVSSLDSIKFVDSFQLNYPKRLTRYVCQLQFWVLLSEICSTNNLCPFISIQNILRSVTFGHLLVWKQVV